MSPKNKGKFGKAKSEIQVEDDFISGMNRLAERLRPYALRLTLFGAALTLVLLGLALHSWYEGRRDAEATSAFSKVLAIVDAKITPPSASAGTGKGAQGAAKAGAAAGDAAKADSAGSAKTAGKTKTAGKAKAAGKTKAAGKSDPPDPSADPPDPSDKKAAKTYPSVAARDKAVLAAVKSLRAKYSGTGVAAESQLLEGAVLLDLGKYDAAAAAYKAYAAGDGPAYLRAMAREGVGYAFEEKALAAKKPKVRQAGLQQALKSFEQMQPAAKGPMHAYALYHQARILGELDQRKAAIARFKKALKATEDQGLSTDINDRLAVLESAPSK